MRKLKIERKEFAHEGKIIAVTDNVFVSEVVDGEALDPVELFCGEEYILDSSTTELELTTYLGNEAKALFIDPDTRSVQANGDVKYDATVITIKDNE